MILIIYHRCHQYKLSVPRGEKTTCGMGAKYIRFSLCPYPHLLPLQLSSLPLHPRLSQQPVVGLAPPPPSSAWQLEAPFIPSPLVSDSSVTARMVAPMPDLTCPSSKTSRFGPARCPPPDLLSMTSIAIFPRQLPCLSRCSVANGLP